MKKNLVLFFCILLSAMTAFASSPKKGERCTVFQTEITCQGCVKEITEALAWEKGITDLKCDLKTQTVSVTYKEKKTNDAQIIAALKKAGKPARIAGCCSGSSCDTPCQTNEKTEPSCCSSKK